MAARLAAPAELVSGTALIGRSVLFRWPDEGWVRGKVARISRAASFSHVVAYGPQSALGSLEVRRHPTRCGLARPERAVSIASPSVSGFHFSGTAVMGYRPADPGPLDATWYVGSGRTTRISKVNNVFSWIGT